MSATSKGNGTEDGGFGLLCARMAVDPGSAPDDLALDLRALLENALAVFDAIADDKGASGLHSLHHSGLYMLRQAVIVAGALQMSPQQGAASLAAGNSP